jgi:hypothetical protein
MNMTKNTIRWICIASAGISLGLCPGCISPGDPRAGTAYEPVRCPTQIDASATVNATATITPGVMASAKRWGAGEDYMVKKGEARRGAIRNDIVTSGLFARIVADNEQADYNVKIEWIEDSPNEELVISAVRAKTKKCATASIKFGEQDNVAGVMAALKAALAAGLQRDIAWEQTALFPKASLPDLIASSDADSACAGARNRALVAAKVQQLSALLREKKTEELTALVVKIEQTELDLNHGSETAKDRAQQLAAENSAAPQIAELRGLAISYQERIELLKPIAVALKEEITNRNR